MDFPEIWNIGKKLLCDNLNNVVTTRSQSANLDHTVLPVNYKESDPDVADSLETDSLETGQEEEEDDEAISQEKPWKDTQEDACHGVTYNSDSASSDNEQPRRDSRAARRKA